MSILSTSTDAAPGLEGRRKTLRQTCQPNRVAEYGGARAGPWLCLGGRSPDGATAQALTRDPRGCPTPHRLQLVPAPSERMSEDSGSSRAARSGPAAEGLPGGTSSGGGRSCLGVVGSLWVARPPPGMPALLSTSARETAVSLACPRVPAFTQRPAGRYAFPGPGAGPGPCPHTPKSLSTPGLPKSALSTVTPSASALHACLCSLTPTPVGDGTAAPTQTWAFGDPTLSLGSALGHASVSGTAAGWRQQGFPSVCRALWLRTCPFLRDTPG